MPRTFLPGCIYVLTRVSVHFAHHWEVPVEVVEMRLWAHFAFETG
jgi:hypothetical protein